MKKKFLILLSLCFCLYLNSQTFTINMGDDSMEWNLFQAYNTTEAQIFTGLYEGLVVYHPASNKPIPGAAESWRLSEDKKSYTFTLRENLYYSNGDPIHAEHFRQSWLQALDPTDGSRFASLLDSIIGAVEYNQGLFTADQVGIEVLSPREIEVHLKEPAPQFLSILCHYSFALVHPTLLDVADWSTLIHQPTSGPFRISQRNANRVTLEKNPYYWDKENVSMEQIELLFNHSNQAAMNLFNDYQIDWMLNGMDSSLLEDGNRLILSPSFATSYYFFSSRQSPWDQEEIRRALAILLPWNEIRDQFMIPGTTLIPPVPQYPRQENHFQQNVQEALRILEEQGYPNGKGLPEIIIRLDASQWGSSVPRLIKEAWEENLDTVVSLEMLPSYLYYDSLSQSGYTLGHVSWVGDYADPMTFLQMWKSDSSFNDAGFQSDAYDQLLSDAALESGIERYRILAEAEALLLRGAEVLPVQHVPSLHFIDLRFIDGWYPNALDIHPLKDIRWQWEASIPGLSRVY